MNKDIERARNVVKAYESGLCCYQEFLDEVIAAGYITTEDRNELWNELQRTK